MAAVLINIFDVIHHILLVVEVVQLLNGNSILGGFHFYSDKTDFIYAFIQLDMQFASNKTYFLGKVKDEIIISRLMKINNIGFAIQVYSMALVQLSLFKFINIQRTEFAFWIIWSVTMNVWLQLKILISINVNNITKLFPPKKRISPSS